MSRRPEQPFLAARYTFKAGLPGRETAARSLQSGQGGAAAAICTASGIGPAEAVRPDTRSARGELTESPRSCPTLSATPRGAPSTQSRPLPGRPDRASCYEARPPECSGAGLATGGEEVICGHAEAVGLLVEHEGHAGWLGLDRPHACGREGSCDLCGAPCGEGEGHEDYSQMVWISAWHHGPRRRREDGPHCNRLHPQWIAYTFLRVPSPVTLLVDHFFVSVHRQARMPSPAAPSEDNLMCIDLNVSSQIRRNSLRGA